MEVTKRSPFIVLEVEDLMDENYFVQGSLGYSNELVKPGDKLLRVDDTGVESATVKQLHELLSGDMHSMAELSLLRGQGGEEYSIQVRRHGRHEHERKPATSNVSSTPSPRGLASPRAIATPSPRSSASLKAKRELGRSWNS